LFDEFIIKEGEFGHKVGRTLTNRVDERRNMINDYLRERACIDSVRGKLISRGELILSFSCSFRDFTAFCAFCWLLWFLSFSWLFGLLVVLHGVLDSNFKLCTFVANGLIKGGLRNQVVSSLV
jgi:hypothetical protein